jgi:type III secretory pathway component EscS
VVAGALAGTLTELLQRRAGIETSALPGVARLLVGLLTVLALGPGTAGQLGRFASAVWTALPTLGR